MLTKLKLALLISAPLVAGAATYAAAQGGPPSRADVIQKFDKNGDGVLDDAERADMKAAFAAKRAAHRQAMLDKFDTNKDGKLDATERAAMRDDQADRAVPGAWTATATASSRSTSSRPARPRPGPHRHGRFGHRRHRGDRPRCRAAPSSEPGMLPAMLPRRVQPLAGWSIVVVFALIGGALLATVWSTRASILDASDAVRCGQADAVEQAVRAELSDLDGMPTAADLGTILHELHDDGLRYLAMVEGHGRLDVLAAAGVAVGTGSANPFARSRAVGCRADEAGGRLRMELRTLRRLKAGGRTLRFLIEVEPVQANSLREAASLTLAVGALAAAALIGVAFVLIRREARRRADAAARERERRLASLGEMSAVLAHEIKNPLASLKGNAQLLARMLPGGDKPRAKADRVVDEAIRLEQLTNDLLQFVRTGTIQRAPADPAQLARDAAATVRRKLDPSTDDSQVVGSGASITVDAGHAPATWSLDASRIREVLINLLDNAVAAGPPVTVALRRDRDRLIIEIADRGPGVAEANRERIFEPFFTGKTQGTGLGLAIVRRVVELHGGTIAVYRKPRRRRHVPRRDPPERESELGPRHGTHPGRRRRTRPARVHHRCARARRAHRGRRPRTAARPREAARRARLRPRAHRSQDAGARRHGAAAQGPRRAARGRGDRDDGARHGRQRGRGDEARRVRVPPEAAVGARRAAPAGRARGRAPRPARPGRRRRAPRRALRPAADLRRSRDAAGRRGDREGRADLGDRAAARRERHRQGGRRPRDPRPQPARRAAVHGDQLRRAQRAAARERAVRPREGRVHRRHRPPARPARARRRRHVLPRRGRRAASPSSRPSCCACCRSAGSSASAAAARSRSTSAGSPRPTATCAR